MVELKETVLKDKEEMKFEFTDANIRKHVLSINEKRGRSGYEPLVYVAQLTKLLDHVKDYELKVELLIALVKIRFEATQIVGNSVMTLEFWKETYANLTLLMAMLNERPSFFIKEGFKSGKHQESIAEDDFKAQANLISYVELLDHFLTLGLKGEEARSLLYVQWLRNEVPFLELAEDIAAYYKRANVQQGQTRIALIQLEHLHYKHDNLLKLMREKGTQKSGREYYLNTNPYNKIKELVGIVYAHGTEKQKQRAMLYEIYHHCLHDRYHQAKSLFVLGRMNQQHMSDLQLQIVYNRALVQLGLAAFYSGDTEAALECLSDVVATNRLREILAQSIPPRKEKSSKVELEEKQHLLPYHMHINTDLVEAAYLISAMLLDVPETARLRGAIPSHPITRHFRKVMQDFERKNVLCRLTSRSGESLKTPSRTASLAPSTNSRTGIGRTAAPSWRP